MTSLLREIITGQSYSTDYYALPVAVTALLIWLLGGVVLLRGALSRITVAFFLITSAIGIWLSCFAMMYGATNTHVALFWARAGYLGVAFLPAACYDFATRVTSSEKRYGKISLLFWFLSLFFFLAAISSDRFIASLTRYYWGYYPRYGPLGDLFLLFFAVATTLSLLIYYQSWRHTVADTLTEERAKSFCIAFAIAYLGSVDFLAKYGLEVYPFGYLPILVFCLLSARAILRHKLVTITPAYAARNIISTMREALFVLDGNGVIRLTNPAAARLLQVAENEILGTTMHTFFSLPLRNQDIHRFVEEGSSNSFEIAGRGSELSARFFELSYSGLKDSAGKVTGLTCIVHDLTEQRQVRQELETANRHLEDRIQERTAELQTAHKRLLQSEKLCAVGKLSASIAHEFGSPIFAIRNLLESIRGSQPPLSDDGQLIELGIQECERLKKMLANLRDFYTPTTETLSMVNLHQIIEEVLVFYRSHLRKKNITVTGNFHADLPWLFGSPDQLKQVVLNLLSNAEEAIPSDGTIEITTDFRENQIVLSVKDSGEGIDEAIIDHIFEPFITTKDQKIGTGLGLSISYGIIKGYGGDIAVDSAPERGTVFTVTLPCPGSLRQQA